MNELALFAGAGGGILGSKLLGWHTRCAVEIQKYPREVLLQRQRDGILNRFPIWDDVSTFDGNPWRGHIDVITGGFPCQDISAAGAGAGITGSRSGLWKEYARIIDEVEPRFIFAENSPLLRARGLGTVIKDLDRLGYDARWCVLGAWHIGGPHKRNRMWVLGHRRELLEERDRSDERAIGEQAACNREGGISIPDSSLLGHQEQGTSGGPEEKHPSGWSYHRWASEPGVGRMVHGLAHRVDRIKAIGNGQVPACAAAAWRILSDGLI